MDMNSGIETIRQAARLMRQTAGSVRENPTLQATSYLLDKLADIFEWQDNDGLGIDIKLYGNALSVAHSFIGEWQARESAERSNRTIIF